ncbi:Catabolic L-serine/threonine dehydratase [Neolecta irregularis DAH-3]|uniref:L-serine ammonia-lyase n=1 Tax=Neolecta irregularis (strain DAH-3) TaxID=1198029 RepID=A0A1U7LR59_NEOID|nr:Catabolic L-serine/threonine dehydratase [Neolecta irregularis DAH-3]|eukprot:OLL25001.1 Catabolic L-serine/threonine dehydratase [Neolecta irregularis DAH-3]
MTPVLETVPLTSLYSETPLIESRVLSLWANCKVYLKLENLQPSGSFKSRGLGLLCKRAVDSLPSDSNKPHFYSSSGGNAGLAVAFAAHTLECPSTIVVPLTTSEYMKSKIKTAGAEVRVHGRVWNETDIYTRELAAEDARGVYCPPFDHDDVVQGNSSLSFELRAQLPSPPDAIICSVGGGGLLAGIIKGLDENGWDRVPVVAVETEGAASFNAAYTLGKLVRIPEINTVATTLGSTIISQTCLTLAQKHHTIPYLVTDAQAVNACWRFSEDHQMLVEPACGASLAIAYTGAIRKILPDLTKNSTVVVIICGGSALTVDLLQNYCERFKDQF